MSSEPEEEGLLVEFETKNLPDDYRKYYKIKRNNFFASIEMYPQLWAFFCKIDAIWKRELTDLEVGMTPETGFPMILYANAHSKIRISIELAFSMCLQEARSVLRDAVELVAHAHHMLRNPANLKVWLEKDDPGGEVAFNRTFRDNKARNLFQGLAELHYAFRHLSEVGSHPTLQSFYNKISPLETASTKGLAISYTGTTDSLGFALELFHHLLTCFVMERTLFDDYKFRLGLDPQLTQMRREFEEFKERLRRDLIKKHKVEPPLAKPVRP